MEDHQIEHRYGVASVRESDTRNGRAQNERTIMHSVQSTCGAQLWVDKSKPRWGLRSQKGMSPGHAGKRRGITTRSLKWTGGEISQQKVAKANSDQEALQMKQAR